MEKTNSLISKKGILIHQIQSGSFLTLKTLEDCLLFILFYFKCYPNRESGNPNIISLTAFTTNSLPARLLFPRTDYPPLTYATRSGIIPV